MDPISRVVAAREGALAPTPGSSVPSDLSWSFEAHLIPRAVGYMGLVALALGLVAGASGFAAAFGLSTKIFAAIKFD